jgi:hypothetical protein
MRELNKNELTVVAGGFHNRGGNGGNGGAGGQITNIGAGGLGGKAPGGKGVANVNIETNDSSKIWFGGGRGGDGGSAS